MRSGKSVFCHGGRGLNDTTFLYIIFPYTHISAFNCYSLLPFTFLQFSFLLYKIRNIMEYTLDQKDSHPLLNFFTLHMYPNDTSVTVLLSEIDVYGGIFLQRLSDPVYYHLCIFVICQAGILLHQFVVFFNGIAA